MLCNRQVIVRKEERMSQVSYYPSSLLPYSNSKSGGCSATRILTLKIRYVKQCMVVGAEDLVCPMPGPTTTPRFET